MQWVEKILLDEEQKQSETGKLTCSLLNFTKHNSHTQKARRVAGEEDWNSFASTNLASKSQGQQSDVYLLSEPLEARHQPSKTQRAVKGKFPVTLSIKVRSMTSDFHPDTMHESDSPIEKWILTLKIS